MAKRITSSAINWTIVTENLSKIDRQKVAPLKLQSEKYLRDISTKPAELPKIEWNIYKTRIGTPGMVDTFQRSYEALKIPYPSDQGELSKVESSNNEMNKFATAQYDKIVAEINELKKQLKELEAIMKHSSMTMEEFCLARPELNVDDKNPKFWPPNYPQDQKSKDA